MKKTGKEKMSQIIFGLLLISLIIVIGVTIREGFRKPVEHLNRGVILLSEKKYLAAEQALIRATDSKDKDIVIQASWKLGNLYKNGADGFEVNGRKAELFLEKAASFGFAPAQYELALLYDVGDKIPENREKANSWMNLAAQEGLPEALYGLGVWIERGHFGKVDMEKVITLYEQAAQKGHLNAMRSLIVLYGDGMGEIPADPQKSTYWLNELKQKMEEKKK